MSQLKEIVLNAEQSKKFLSALMPELIRLAKKRATEKAQGKHSGS